MKKENSKKLIAIIIILIIALLGSISYIVYDKVLKEEKIEEKEQEKPKKEQNKSAEKRALTNEEQAQILTQIKEYTSILAALYPITEDHPLTNQDVLNFALLKMEDLGKNMMESDIEKILQTYFGTNHPYIHEDIDCFAGDGVLYKYNSAKREYIFQNTHSHGGPGSYFLEVFYIDGTVEENKYTVNVNIVYGDYCGGVCGPSLSYYKNQKDSINRENPILGPYEESHDITNEEYDTIKSSLPVTTFTFEKDEKNNYGLKIVKL